MQIEGRKRVVIEGVKPEINGGLFAIKRIVNEPVKVEADIFSDGHEEIAAILMYRNSKDQEWREVPMSFLLNDRWTATFIPLEVGEYLYTLQAWVDHFKTWQKDIRKKIDAGQDVSVDLRIGADFLKRAAERAPSKESAQLKKWAEILNTDDDQAGSRIVALNPEVGETASRYPDKNLSTFYHKELMVHVDRKKAKFSTWYEIFPRSFGKTSGKYGTFKDCEKLLPRIAEMGFDVLYFPPIHPIGQKNRKGKNNSTISKPGDPGSPWAIGSAEGGHKSVHPELGPIADFKRFTKKAIENHIEIALDLAFQCSPDHPYVKEHPEWFKWRPDGTVQYAENPPKKYQDVLPVNFETENWQELWEELKSVVFFWIEQGVRIFRIDNPHTKPFAFWEWLIIEVRKEYPDIIFLSEAFTRPKVMYRLAKVGFSQSYTYFTWRNTKWEFMDYMNELTRTEVKEVFRPNFWPNTPDILPEHLQFGNRNTFIIRLMLAATLSSNYGMYAPAFELMENRAVDGKEEYLNSEKYEIKNWNLNSPDSLQKIITTINRIRHENTALQDTNNIDFLNIDNEHLLGFIKTDEELSNIILVVINMDSYSHQAGRFALPLDKLEIPQRESFLAHELISDTRLFWQGKNHSIMIDPDKMPAKIFRLYRRIRREKDFDYFM